ncbi:nitroreductase family protein [Clostridium butyricum]|uniref:NAD(P)H nitroreductase n=1 Tax=Clostridium butyricum TaxID=1492 RepID=A0A2S7FBX3_CLOBU|nr:nitroreductase family protein [Clostridium butyricum]KHD16274.1 NAD(P)H nitroreductase [Clostridium butyricum]MBS5981712.1 nitroreductase family protein [Clostridium butyricum]MDB2150494.1 nitroreductase family protein [Clostridium butyricum]MDU1006152.1 nitroreductase family protein [Clostridium butyricum]PPV15455.1 NAD(P)H nitroreductase [Clostridium butyricum]
MKDFLELVNRRQSCRKYLDKPVEKEKIIKCIEAARVAPSACNSQPWHFIVVNNKELSSKVADCLQDSIMNKFTSECKTFIIAVEESGNITSRAGELIKRQDFRATDVAIACEHICLMAEELELGTCILGWFNEKSLKKLLNIQSGKRVRLVIAMGYPDSKDVRKKVRKNLDDIYTIYE